jgi:hypothetical protein
MRTSSVSPCVTTASVSPGTDQPEAAHRETTTGPDNNRRRHRSRSTDAPHVAASRSPAERVRGELASMADEPAGGAAINTCAIAGRDPDNEPSATRISISANLADSTLASRPGNVPHTRAFARNKPQTTVSRHDRAVDPAGDPHQARPAIGDRFAHQITPRIPSCRRSAMQRHEPSAR